MSNTQHIQSNFTAGEISPRLMGRADLQKYYNAASAIENFLLMKQGGLIRRSGTRYVAAQKTQSKVGRLIPFVYSNSQQYILEFGNQTLRIYRNEAQLIDPTPGGSPTEISTPYTEAQLPDLKFTQSADTMIICHPSYTPRKLTRSSGDDTESSTWSMSVFTARDGPYIDLGDDSITLAPSALTGNITITAVGGNVFIASDAPSGSELGRLVRIRHAYRHQEKVITAATAANPGVVTVTNHGYDEGDFVRFESMAGGTWDTLNGHIFRVKNPTANTFALDDSHEDPVDTSGLGTYTASSGRVSLSTASRLYGWGVARITVVNSATSVDATVITGASFFRAIASDTWALGAWSVGQGWPACCEYHGNRLYFSTTLSEPQTFWTSLVGLFTHFEETDQDDDTNKPNFGLRFTINDTTVNTIRHLKSTAKGVFIFTDSGPFSLKSGDTNEPISSVSFVVKREGTDGISSRVRPFVIGPAILYINADGLTLHEFKFDIDVDQYVTPDLTVLAEHITAGGVIDMAYQFVPNRTVWLLRADGVLLAMTYERSEQVIGWHRHIIGGTGTVVESIAVIRQGSTDELWMTVKRTISGTVRYVEYMLPQFGISDALTAAKFSDSSLSYSGVAVTSVTGLSHLNGETVAIIANGAAQANGTVSAGAVAVPAGTTTACVGLPYTSKVTSVPLVISGSGGDSRGRKLRPYRCDLVLHNTANGTITADNAGNLDTIQYPDTGLDTLFTGVRDVPVSENHVLRPLVEVRQTQPLPMTLLSLITWLQVDGN